MKVLIVSGFLGAGKTTFIKELIRRTEKFPVILENEYGDNNLDSRSLKEGGEIEILEFLEGCVCCTKRDSFVNTVLSISAAMDPEYLVIEPTGIGKLGAIAESIKKISYERIELLPTVLVLNPATYRQHLISYPAICRDQIKCADTIVFSKVENADEDFVSCVASEIHELNPSAKIVTRHYTGETDSWWDSLWFGSSDKKEQSKIDQGNIKVRPYIEPEQLSLNDVNFNNLAELIAFLEDIIHGGFGGIVRAKGVVPVGNSHLRFDVADNLYAIKEESEGPDDELTTQCVLIGSNIKVDEIIRRASAFKDLSINLTHDALLNSMGGESRSKLRK